MGEFGVMVNEVITGRVKWFTASRGYGFVVQDDDESAEFFVHYSQINMDGYKTLEADQKVTFILVETDKGVQAHEVTPLGG